MATKALKKKFVALRKYDEFPEPSGSVEKYPITQIRAITVGVTRKVTRG